jgi:predicted nucleic acid-binding protein
VIFDFLEIGRLDLLVRLYEKIHVVAAVDAQVKRDCKSYDAWREDFPIRFPEPEWELELVRLRRKYGWGVGDADRAAAIAAKRTGGLLLTRDNRLKREAKKCLEMDDRDFVGTVEILRNCVELGFISKRDALMLCDDISDKRCPQEDLDRSILEELSDPTS